MVGVGGFVVGGATGFGDVVGVVGSATDGGADDPAPVVGGAPEPRARATNHAAAALDDEGGALGPAAVPGTTEDAAGATPGPAAGALVAACRLGAASADAAANGRNPVVAATAAIPLTKVAVTVMDAANADRLGTVDTSWSTRLTQQISADGPGSLN